MAGLLVQYQIRAVLRELLQLLGLVSHADSFNSGYSFSLELIFILIICSIYLPLLGCYRLGASFGKVGDISNGSCDGREGKSMNVQNLLLRHGL